MQERDSKLCVMGDRSGKSSGWGTAWSPILLWCWLRGEAPQITYIGRIGKIFWFRCEDHKPGVS